MARKGSGTWFTHVRGAIIIFPWVVWLLLIDISVSALLPIKSLFPNFTYDLSSALAWTVWRWIQWIFEDVNGARVTISGDPLPANGESAVIVANHVSWNDFYMVQAVAVRAGMLGRCRYFAKIQLRAVPFLGWGLWALGMPMVTRNWLRDRDELNRVFEGIVNRRWPTWLVSFSEATRFTPKKYEESKQWCATNGKPQPKHLLYPRTKGFIATVQHLRHASHVKAVYDLAIAYQKDGSWMVAPVFWDTLSVPGLSAPGPHGFRFHVHVRRFPIEELPQSDADLARWLEQRWVDKGEWLEGLRQRWAEEEKDEESKAVDGAKV
ncbi:hypothetical protein MCOR25_009051 [Pyricularia grisea]|uniref:Phospholipid/glycerol acyltransferase domain-containing protein n=1 Tax=Pyricularia grisea TaxID=148305 RepID=A0A6P8AV06_PYRGI|nr:uncharacterized protein PgNI_09000 [Pyricularia grisea]KAI6353297.1 hypothetical protein MCOR25_009051 [Pyricularia grisea]TLD06047.1 hypothetical protein PgNI_09000 [Pyricularia grisea]